MTKMSKIKINARRKTQSAERKVKSTQRQLSHVQMEAQIAQLQEQITLMQEASGLGSGEKDNSTRHTAPDSPLSRTTFPAPEVGHVFAAGPNAVTVHWNVVPGVGSYTLRLATDADFTTDYQTMTLPAVTTGTTVAGLKPATTYFVGVRANAQSGSGDVNSGYSETRAVTTPNLVQNGIAGDLQNWLTELQTLNRHFLSLLPDAGGEVLLPAERRRLRGSGVRRYGYIDKVSDIAAEYPQFWPAFIGGDDDPASGSERLKKLIREIEVLRNLLIAFRNGAQNAEDMLLTAGDDAFRLANFYYRNVRDAARSKVAGAANVFEMLQLFWQRPRRNGTSEEPTLPEIERDFRGVLHGRKDGFVNAQHESPKLTGGSHEVIDDLR